MNAKRLSEMKASACTAFSELMAEFERLEWNAYEPIIHSHTTDTLHATHPLAHKDVSCDICRVALHAFNNECMQAWIETGVGNFCIPCFAYKNNFNDGVTAITELSGNQYRGLRDDESKSWALAHLFKSSSNENLIYQKLQLAESILQALAYPSTHPFEQDGLRLRAKKYFDA